MLCKIFLLTACVTDNEQLGVPVACRRVCWEVVQCGAWSEWSCGGAVSTNTAPESAAHCADSRRAAAHFQSWPHNLSYINEKVLSDLVNVIFM